MAQSWPRFGKAENEDPSETTDISYDEVYMQDPNEQEPQEDMAEKIRRAQIEQAMKARVKAMLDKEEQERKFAEAGLGAPGAAGAGPGPGIGGGLGGGPGAAAGPGAGPGAAAGTGKYQAAFSNSMGRFSEEPKIKVSSLDEAATEEDLRDLCSHYGMVDRVHIARDRETFDSRGFAFVSFLTRRDAQRALEGLNRKPYGYRVLHVEWAKPSTRDPARDNSMRHASGYGKALPQTMSRR